MRCAIWYQLYNLRKVKNTHGGVLLLEKLQASASAASACNFTKSNTPPWAFFMFLKLYKWYQIAQSIAYLFGRTTITATSIQSRKLFIKFTSPGNNIEYVDFD